MRHDADGERAGQARPQIAPAPGAHDVDERTGPGGGPVAVALLEPARPERGDEGERCRVLGAVEREHARPDHPGGEARVVHGEGGGVAHDRHGRVVSGDQPPVELGQPRQRGLPAQPRQQLVRARARQLVQHRHGRAVKHSRGE